jgi:UDP-glucose 4-epimerase
VLPEARMKVLVTGGAGYIGSVVAQHLIDSGHGVIVYDNLSRGHREAVPSAAELVVGDVADREALDGVLPRVEAVMHFAGSIEAGESMLRPELYFRNNAAGTLTLLEAMLAARVDRIVFSSTAALYGDPERTPIREDDKLEPINAYGESKLLVERMLAWFHRVHRVRYASLRYFNAAGATADRGEAHEPETHLIPLVLQVALGKRDRISIFGTDYPTPDGTCVRDYVHVHDLATAHLRALELLESRDRLIYNVGTGRGHSVREVIEAARRVTGHRIDAVEMPRRPGDPAVLVASAERIRTELAWEPEHASLDAIIESAWAWHRRA